MTNVGVITQARMSSSRLPGKIMLEAGGRTMLQHHVDRLLAADLAVCIATTTNPADDLLVPIAADLGVPIHRGSEQDVLARFVGAIEQLALDIVVRVTSDCPLIDGELVRLGIDNYISAGDPYCYVSNTLQRTYPRGFDFEVFSAAALLEAHQSADRPAEREHVTPYLHGNRTGRASLRSITREVDTSGFRVTLDTADDFKAIQALIEDYGAASLNAEQIIEILQAHPELAELNAHIEQKKLGH